MAELKNSIYSIEDGQQTCSGDVVHLISYHPEIRKWRPFDLYKIDQVGLNQKTDWTYVLLIEDDKFPVIITKELAQKIIDNPEEGGKIAYSVWMSRYR